MYELVLIDADDTLFDYKRAELNALSESLKFFGYIGEYEIPAERYHEINTGLWKQLEKGEVTKEFLKVERFKKLFIELNFNYSPAEFSNLYLENLASGGFLLDGAEEICSYLSGKYKIILVTNGIEYVQKSRLAHSAIKKYISGLVTSEIVGVNKPDARMFDFAIKTGKCTDKSKVIMIGDMLSSDILGGNNFGIDTCWYNPSGAVNTLNILPKYEVNDLLKIKQIL